MSGIAGIIHFDGRPVAPGQIEAMTAAMPYRGPDGINHWRRGNIALGQCMLRTTPESLEETQPLTNEDESLVLVMDGRVDNWEELRRDLLAKGAVLRTRADAELVLRAYEVWGDACPDRVIGEYVFVFWDARHRRVFAARDAAGTRHFYYYRGDGWFAFASEIRSLLTLPISRVLNETRLLDALAVEYDRDDEIGTVYKDILRLAAGHIMNASAQQQRVWRWWNPGDLQEQKFQSMSECVEAFKHQLCVAIAPRLRALKPVGAMLSGGLDSSTIVGLISKEFRNNLHEPLRTFSLIREDRENCADWPSIDAVLRADPWLQPTVIRSSAASAINSNFSHYLSAFDEPSAYISSLVVACLLDEVKAAGCGSIFDGTAGDLHFYHDHESVEAIIRRRELSALPGVFAACWRHRYEGSIRRLLRSAVWQLAPEWGRALVRALKQLMPNHDGSRERSTGDLLYLFRPEVADRYVAMRQEARAKRKAALEGSSDQARHASRFTSGTLSYAHEITGLATLSRGLEPRSPFSDRRLIEFSIRMPLKAKLMRYWYKYALRQISAQLLPVEVPWRMRLIGHPGHKFHAARIKAITRYPAVWDKAVLASLSPWVDLIAINGLVEEYELNSRYVDGFNAHTGLAVATWLRDRFPSER